MSLIPIVTGLFSAIAAVTSATIATRALRATRRSALIAHLLAAYGDMIAALHEIEDTSQESTFPALTDETKSALRQAFRRFQSAAARVAIVEPVIERRPGILRRQSTTPVSDDMPEGEWVRNVANNLAWNLTSPLIAADHIDLQKRGGRFISRPDGIPDSEWKVLSSNTYYLHVLNVLSDLPQPRTSRPQIEPTARQRALATQARPDQPSIYAANASYLPQTARVLSDFVHEYVIPWCQRVAATVTDTKLPRD
ncbi:hypothetical protein [Nocardia niigatensis]